PYWAPLATPNAQWVTLLTSRARVGGSSMSNSPSTSRFPTCAGAGAPSQFDSPEENSQSVTLDSPPPRRYREYHRASIAAVPSAPATTPRVIAMIGVGGGVAAVAWPARRRVSVSVSPMSSYLWSSVRNALTSAATCAGY